MYYFSYDKYSNTELVYVCILICGTSLHMRCQVLILLMHSQLSANFLQRMIKKEISVLVFSTNFATHLTQAG